MGSFKDVVGHKDIIQYIRNAVSMEKVSHAYIMNGARGSGKKMLASLFAMTLLCEKKVRSRAIPVIPVSRQKAITIRISSGLRMKNRIRSVWTISVIR